MTTGRKIVLLLLGAAALTWWWYSGTHVRFILTVEIDVDGQRRTASSVIGGDYYPRKIIRLGPGTGGPAHIRGISPMFDLGERGTLFAALQGDTAEYVRVYKNWAPARVLDLPMLAYGIDVHSVWRVQWRDAVEVREEHYPGFIWVPPTQRWGDAMQMKHFDVPKFVSPMVRVTKVTITPSYWSSIKTTVEPAPDWLEVLRERTRVGALKRGGQFHFENIFIESYNPYDPYRGAQAQR